LHAWYQSSDVFCLPSADEYMPLTPVEAAWHGLPVVLSDLECHQDFWRHGVNALIHPVGDVQILAWCLNLLLESPSLRARLAGAGRAVTSRFTEPCVGPLFDAALRDAIATFGAASPLPR
jgi:glycosyltransferase involved in cell wall biosynthesis